MTGTSNHTFDVVREYRIARAFRDGLPYASEAGNGKWWMQNAWGAWLTAELMGKAEFYIH